MQIKIDDIIDVAQNQKLLDSFCESVGIAAAIIDLDGQVIIGARWQRICTEFFRDNELSSKRCIESDTTIANRLEQGESYSLYRCKNGLYDAASPILVEETHIANAFVGQFLLEPPDEGFFREQAKAFGFDEVVFLEALAEVPVFEEQQIRKILRFLVHYAGLLSDMVMTHRRQLQVEKRLSEAAREILDLSTPILELWDGIIAAPLIGTLDSHRTYRFMERLLQAIVDRQAPVCIVDITGVPYVDTQTAQHIMETITAAKLLGTEVLMTGVSPTIAQTMVHLGVDFSTLKTHHSLSAGLAVAIESIT